MIAFFKDTSLSRTLLGFHVSLGDAARLGQSKGSLEDFLNFRRMDKTRVYKAW